MWVENLPGFHPSNDGNIAGKLRSCTSCTREALPIIAPQRLATFGRSNRALCRSWWGNQNENDGPQRKYRTRLSMGLRKILRSLGCQGFTAEEATVLIGAHTIGLIRNTFGTGAFAGPVSRQLLNS